jgi:hypothetical protein
MGELACKERQRRSRTVRGQEGGERESRGRRKERSDACAHGESAASSFREFTEKQIGPPEGSPFGFN